MAQYSGSIHRADKHSVPLFFVPEAATMFQIASPNLANVVGVAAGLYHSLAVRADGTVWAWGGNGNGQLGDGTNTQRLSPVQVVGLTGVTQVSAGNNFSMALKTDGGASGS